MTRGSRSDVQRWRAGPWLALAVVSLATSCSSDGGGGGGTTGGGLDVGGAADAATGSDQSTDGGVSDAGASADGDTDAGDTATVDTGTLDTAGLDAAAGDGATTGGDTATAGPTFGKVWKEVFVAQGCSGAYCHGGVWPNQAATYKQLLAAKSFDKACATAAHVTKGKPAQSLLWLKMDAAANHGCGKKMPLGEAGVPAAASKLVKDWILAGAPQ